MTFRARVYSHTLTLGDRVTFLPDSYDPAGLPPPIPAGVAVPLALSAAGDHLDWNRLTIVMLTIAEASPAEIVATTPAGRRYRLTPLKPNEPGGYWRPNRGMSEWVVRGEG